MATGWGSRCTSVLRIFQIRTEIVRKPKTGRNDQPLGHILRETQNVIWVSEPQNRSLMGLHIHLDNTGYLSAQRLGFGDVRDKLVQTQSAWGPQKFENRLLARNLLKLVPVFG